MILKMQIIRKGTKYESYRVSIPKSLVEHYDLKNCKFKIEYKEEKKGQDKLILIPIRKKVRRIQKSKKDL